MILAGIFRKERKKERSVFICGARMETERPKAVVKLDTFGVEHARMLKPRLIRHQSAEQMDKTSRLSLIEHTKISITTVFSKPGECLLTFCLLLCLLMWQILSDSIHRVSNILFLCRVKLSLTGDTLVRNASSRQKTDIFFAFTESLTGERTILPKVWVFLVVR